MVAKSSDFGNTQDSFRQTLSECWTNTGLCSWLNSIQTVIRYIWRADILRSQEVQLQWRPLSEGSDLTARYGAVERSYCQLEVTGDSWRAQSDFNLKNRLVASIFGQFWELNLTLVFHKAPDFFHLNLFFFSAQPCSSSRSLQPQMEFFLGEEMGYAATEASASTENVTRQYDSVCLYYIIVYHCMCNIYIYIYVCRFLPIFHPTV